MVARSKARSQVTQAAAQLLQERIKYIETLDRATVAEAAAQDRVRTAESAARDARTATHDAYAAARTAGWTGQELAALGYGTARKASARRQGTAQRSADGSDAPPDQATHPTEEEFAQSPPGG
jgi:hypothetical protein